MQDPKWLAGLVQSTVGVAIAAAAALWVLHLQLKHDRKLFNDQNERDLAAKIARDRAAVVHRLGVALRDIGLGLVHYSNEHHSEEMWQSLMFEQVPNSKRQIRRFYRRNLATESTENPDVWTALLESTDLVPELLGVYPLQAGSVTLLLEERKDIFWTVGRFVHDYLGSKDAPRYSRYELHACVQFLLMAAIDENSASLASLGERYRLWDGYGAPPDLAQDEVEALRSRRARAFDPDLPAGNVNTATTDAKLIAVYWHLVEESYEQVLGYRGGVDMPW